MTNSTKPRVTAEELEALIKDWGAGPVRTVDKFFPFRFWYLFILCILYAGWLLFGTDSAVQRMTVEPAEVVRMGRFLYFRGWFIVGILVFGCYCYIRNWYPAIVLSAIFVAASVNLVFDMFNVYAGALARPTPQFTVMLIARLTALWFLFLSAKNSSRLPDVRDRLNIMILFRRDI